MLMNMPRKTISGSRQALVQASDHMDRLFDLVGKMHQELSAVEFYLGEAEVTNSGVMDDLADAFVVLAGRETKTMRPMATGTPFGTNDGNLVRRGLNGSLKSLYGRIQPKIGGSSRG